MAGTRSIRFNVSRRATAIRLCRGYGGRVANGYKCFWDRTKANVKKATWAAAFGRVGWDFRPALWANSGCADHCGRVAHALPLFLMRKILSEVMPGLQQFNREAHPHLPGAALWYTGTSAINGAIGYAEYRS